MIQVILYSRADCHLCHQVESDLAALQAEFPHQLAVIDIDQSPALQRLYGLEIPVVEIGAYTLKAPISQAELRQALALGAPAAPPDPIEASSADAPSKNQRSDRPTTVYRTSNTWSRSDSFTLWFSKHYLAVLNTLVGLFVLLPFMAPVFLRIGWETPAAFIYKAYGVTCHQLSFRSLFLFGQQVVYPRAAAGMDNLLSFSQATGLSEGSDAPDIYAARDYTGSPLIGYKVALCERDIALYGAILLFGLLFAITGRRIPPLPWYLWLLLGILPVALDGLSQVLSQPPFNFIPYRESTPMLRSLTGFLFGFTTAWFGYPVIDQTMRDTQEMMEVKQRRVQAVRQAKPGA